MKPLTTLELFPARLDHAIDVFESTFDGDGASDRRMSGWCYDTAKGTIRFDRAVTVEVVVVEFACAECAIEEPKEGAKGGR